MMNGVPTGPDPRPPGVASTPAAPVAGLRRTTPRTSGRRPVASFGEDRVCADPACATRLSRYNSTSRCAIHQGAPS